jgi:hypothetical protein
METKLPNFLIVGAAKSGTTSLYHYLKQHPEIYMSPVKEPRFITSQFIKFPLKGIGDDGIEKRIIKDFNEYKYLFKKVKNEKAIGDASLDNLYFYEDATKYIKKYLGDAKIIIILRNPIERAFSQHTMFIRELRENLSFEDALKAEEERISKNWAFGWHYTKVGFYYKQIRAYLGNFTNVKIYLFDDLKSDPLGLIKDIYKFLEVDDTFIPKINTIYNVSGIPKSKFINNLLLKAKIFKPFMMQISRLFFLEEKMLKLTEWLDTINLEKPQMKPETREYLKNLFREDILKLQTLINRDLSHWLK